MSTAHQTNMQDTGEPEHNRRAQDRAHPEDSAFRAGKVAADNRWLLLIVGIVTLIGGLAAIAMPLLASITAALLVGWILIASGAIGLVTAFRRRDGWHIAAAFAVSVVSILGGVLMLAQPISGIIALTTVLIIYFAAAGLVRAYYGVRMWQDGGGWMIATGALSFLLALLLFVGLPFSAAWVPGVILGVDLVFWGAVQIALALRQGRASNEAMAT